MYCRSRPQYRSDLGWILGVAFLGTLTRSARPAQGFTYVRCCSAPPASSPHDLAAAGRIVSRRPHLRAVASCGCFQLAPQRTCTSNPGSMPGTPMTSLSGGPKEGPSLTAAARGGQTCLRSGRKKACGAVEQKNGVKREDRKALAFRAAIRERKNGSAG